MGGLIVLRLTSYFLTHVTDNREIMLCYICLDSHKLSKGAT
jgi:hypothetical protein